MTGSLTVAALMGAVGVDSQRSCSRHSIGRVSWSLYSGIVFGGWAITGSLTVAAQMGGSEPKIIW